MAKRVSIINFKGGVGKTTLALHLGCHLGGQGKRVLLVDVDHQSTLSITCLDPDLWEQVCDSKMTVDRVFRAFGNMGISMPGQEIITRTPFGTSYPTVDVLPAQLELDDTEIELASTMIGDPIASEWTKRTLLCKWLSESGADDEYDYIIFDCPPATKLVSQNAIAASECYVLPVIPDRISTRGVTHFKGLISDRIDKRLQALASMQPADRIPSTYVPNTKIGGIVISIAQTHGPAYSGFVNEHTEQMSALRSRWGNDVLTRVIEKGMGVAESLGRGWPVFNQTWSANVTTRGLPAMFSAVCDELAQRL